MFMTLIDLLIFIPEPGMDPGRTDARNTGGDPLHARQVEVGATHRGGVQGVHSGLPVHSGQWGHSLYLCTPPIELLSL